ncbi:MAG: hypothetical protein OXI60_11815 [Acidiferrobacterales bacterium]|nr:hypothetical protein [Acidiferrobacterales bacterium]
MMRAKSTLLGLMTAVMVVATQAVLADNPVRLHEQILTHSRIGQVHVMVPENYQLEILNDQLRRPRLITFAPNGDMFIGSESRVYLLKPPYEQAIDYLYLDGYPHSVAIRGEEMFIASTGALFKAHYKPETVRINAVDLTLVTRLPGGFGHSSRTVAVSPGNEIFVSIGISGNCNNQMISDSYPFKDRRGGLFRLDESSDPDRLVPFASGLRNPVGFDWHPTSHVMYATNNGPDHLGFDQPPEYFSKITPGSFHGMPWYQYDGQSVRKDPCITAKAPYPVGEVSIPVALFPSRNAPLGVAFVPTEAMDKRFQSNAIVALHGSWGTQPDGLFTGSAASRRPPAVVMVRFIGEESAGVEPIVTGFQNEDGRRWARPAGVAVGPDGSLYITSDSGDLHGLLRLRRKNN